MDTITGKRLHDHAGVDVGAVVDVLGRYEGADELGWLVVKLGWRTTRLVPDQGVEPDGEGLRTPLSKDQISNAPKVAPHFEPAGDDREALCSHYGIRLAGL